MRFIRNRKPIPIDFDHMKTLHEECIEQLELMKVSLEAAQLANYLLRDKLDNIATKHWHTYIDMIHILCMHDEVMNLSMKKIGLDIALNDTIVEQQYQTKRILLLGLLRALIRHHQRIIYIYNVDAEPTKDYLDESVPLDREYLVNIIEMIHNTL